MVGVDFAEDHLRVCYVHSEALEHGDRGLELLEGHPAVVAGVDHVEGLPVLVVLSQVQDQELELRFGNVIIAVGVGGFEFVLCSVESADDDWLESEEGWQFHNIPQALVDLGQTQVAVVVDIDVRPVLESLLFVLRVVADGQLGLDLFGCHILSVYKLHPSFHLRILHPPILI